MRWSYETEKKEKKPFAFKYYISGIAWGVCGGGVPADTYRKGVSGRKKRV